jgi:heme oxygenase
MIHSNLKSATQNSHAALETRLRVLLSDDLSLPQYAAVQKKFYGFYQPIEVQLASIHGWDDPEVDIQSRLKLPLLASDLLSLAVDPTEIQQLPLCGSIPRLETVPEALGCLYVLEGSTLGGRIITRHLKTILPVDENLGCTFFNSYGADVGRMWSTFLGVLARHSEKNHDDDVVVESACKTFSSLENWFSNAA